MYIIDDESLVLLPSTEPMGCGAGLRYNHVSRDKVASIKTIFVAMFKDSRMLQAVRKDIGRTLINTPDVDDNIIMHRDDKYILAYWWPPAPGGVAYKVVTRIT